MKIVDANVLLYAVNEDAPHHRAAREWLDSALSGGEAVGFSWVVLLAFLRLSTRTGLFERPLALEDAARVIEAWMGQPAAVIAGPTSRHLGVLTALLAPLGTASNLVTDAHLAALATEHGAEVVSFDADFSRFQGVRWLSPAT
jgi:uncharacterized protein